MDLFKPLIALLAIVNPIGVLPFFIHFTQGFTREQRRATSDGLIKLFPGLIGATR